MKKSMCFFAVLFLGYQAFSQNANPDNFQKMIDFLPPAPNAAEIIKHSQLAINKNTGSPAVNIPLLSLNGYKLGTGVSLSYSSTGIKVDDIASRVGIGWAINAGGVITRTMRGVPDEYNARLSPPSPLTSNCAAYNFFTKTVNSSTCMGPGCNGFDTEPDLYNFNMNGISGSFVFSHNMEPIVMPANRFKIEFDFSPTASWNFKITGTDGIRYYFGGAGATEKTKRESNCGKTYDQYMPGAWYLKQIEHSNGETINFNYTPLTYAYETGVSETQNWAYYQIRSNIYIPPGSPAQFGCPTATCPTAPPNTKCINKVRTQGVLLTSILTNNNTSILFGYTTRQDCEDKLVDNVGLYKGNQLISKFGFTYNQQQANMTYANEVSPGHDKTPYLTRITEYSSDLLLTKEHYFSYNDPLNRPPRLSFSQDHWGYFNGRANSSFIPKPADIVQRQRFPQATANREADESFASKGMLTKIIYPTGGIDNIEYESNLVQNTDPTYKTQHQFNCSVTGIGNGPWTTVTKNFNFSIDKPQVVEVVITSIDNTGNGGFDPIHNKSRIVIAVSGGATILDEAFVPGTTSTRYLNPSWPLAAGAYILTYQATGQAVTTNVTLSYKPISYNLASSLTVTGGVRVKRVTTSNPGETPMIKRYYYGEPDALNISTLNPTFQTIYKKDYVKTLQCQLNMGTGNGSSPAHGYCDQSSMYSASLVNLFTYGSSLMSYGSIVESNGENFEGGGIHSKFYVGPDSKGPVVWGNEILGTPLTNSSNILNGKLQEETLLKKANNGVLIPLKKSTYNYIIDSRVQRILYGYTVNQAYNIYLATPGSNCSPETGVSEEVTGAFDMVRYDMISYWTHPETVTETLYDENGQNPLTTTTTSYFDSEQHLQPTRSEVTNSKNQLIRNTNTYPQNYVGNAVYDAMLSNNIITPVIESASDIVTSSTTSIPLASQKINYGNTGNNNFLPVMVEKSVKGNPLQTEGTIDKYDERGNIQQFTSKAGVVTAILWGYNQTYPVAQVVGTTYSVVVSNLTTPIENMQSLDGQALLNELNVLRTSLSTALVTTYTYKPGVGVTSITDPTNRTNSYEYDAFNRLLYIKDQEGNYVKKNEYNYVIPNPQGSGMIYFNQLRTLNIQCQTCTGGFTGSFVQYVIPFGKYFSLLSQADAEAKADADIGGQEYANRNGYCSNSISCTQPGYKFVGCDCELGQKICEYSTPDAGNPGAYFAHFHFQWSDGSVSPSFTDYVSSCSGVDKKFLNCVCETGVKVCDNTVNNGGGSYTLTYHYRWSDGSTSSPIVETFSCNGPDKKIINCICETGRKMYTASVLCSGKNPPAGCCTGMWLCTFYYRWSDGSISQNYTECAAANCMDME